MDYKYTVAIDQGNEHKTPKSIRRKTFHDKKVLGFLVSLQGIQKGTYFPIYESITNICDYSHIPLEDIKKASIKKAMIIKYDEENNVFYLNERVKENILKSHDIIEFENIKLIFIPFCEGNRKWS